MSLKSSLLALANNIGMCQENARSIKQALAGGLAEAGAAAAGDWELVKTETGSTEISLPEGFHEIYIKVFDNANHIVASVVFPEIALEETVIDYRTGYYGSNSFYSATDVKVSKTKVSLDSVNKEGSLITASSIISVYAR